MAAQLPAAPGSRWSAAERSRLLAQAPNGIAALRRALPGRTTAAIYRRATAWRVPIAPTPHGGSNWRGHLRIPRHAHPLVRQLVGAANEQKTTIGEIAERAGLHPETVSEWRYRKIPKLDTFIAALNVLDLDLAIVHRREGAS